MTRRLLTICRVIGLAAAFTSLASAATCDRTCLLEQAKQFNANMLAHTTDKIALTANVLDCACRQIFTSGYLPYSNIKGDDCARMCEVR